MPQQTITTTGAEVLPRNPYRRSIIFNNPSVNIIYVETMPPGGITTSNAGIRMPGGATRTFSWLDDGPDVIVDQWSAISDTGSNTLVFREQISTGLTTKQLEEALAEKGL